MLHDTRVVSILNVLLINESQMDVVDDSVWKEALEIC